MDEWTFQHEIKTSPFNLPLAALLFAREIAYPQLDVAHYMAQLDALSQRAAQHIDGGEPVHIQAELLSEFLFREEGFQGNTAEYEDPRNSYLNEVLDRRLGIPISLSTIYITVAQRLEIPAYGVGMPGHFIVTVRDRNRELFFDPFHGGGRLSETDCARLVQLTVGYQGAFRENWLSPLSPVEILARMLNNLRLVYWQQAMWPKATAVIRHLHMLQPEAAEHIRDLGVAYYRAGDIRQAAHFLNAYLERDPDASDADMIRQGIARPLAEWVLLN